MILDLLAAWAAFYAASLGLYLATGLLLERLNARNPGARIQPGRDGMRRRAEDIRHSMAALALSALFLAGGWTARASGWTVTPWETTWLTLLLGFLVAFLTYDAWFYFGHRLLHLPAFWPWHALHHRALAPTPWSNDSSTLADTAVEHSYYLVAWFVLPVPAEAFLALRVFDQVTGMIGHSGHEYFAGRSARWPSPFITTTFHDLHHSRFRCNYGNFLSIWDRLLGTVHPGYDRMIAEMERGRAPAEAAARAGPPLPARARAADGRADGTGRPRG